MPSQDVIQCERDGWALVDDLVSVSGDKVIMEVETQTFKPMPLAIVRDPDRLRGLVPTISKGRLDTQPTHLYRLEYLYDLIGLARHYGRGSPSVFDWTRHPRFPAPVRTFGRVKIWYLPDVEAWRKTRPRIKNRKR